MLQYNPLQYLPSSAELPDSDDTPVDNELQDLVPHLLKAILAFLWQDRTDWFFGVDMGIYYTPGVRPTPIVPDGFLSLGVERLKSERGRLSYVLWEENYIVPVLALEIVSQNYGGEYDEKQTKYAQLGVLYYVIYNPEFWARDQDERALQAEQRALQAEQWAEQERQRVEDLTRRLREMGVDSDML